MKVQIRDRDSRSTMSRLTIGTFLAGIVGALAVLGLLPLAGSTPSTYAVSQDVVAVSNVHVYWTFSPPNSSACPGGILAGSRLCDFGVSFLTNNALAVPVTATVTVSASVPPDCTVTTPNPQTFVVVLNPGDNTVTPPNDGLVTCSEAGDHTLTMNVTVTPTLPPNITESNTANNSASGSSTATQILETPTPSPSPVGGIVSLPVSGSGSATLPIALVGGAALAMMIGVWFGKRRSLL